MNISLDERKKNILTIVVENYIETGEPVGSTAVVQKLNNSVSSATIRNEMSALEKLGLLIQPHTSAGRIPTQTGYRFYIDYLMKKKKLSEKELNELKNIFDFKSTGFDPEGLIEAFSQAVAEFTNFASVSTLPVPPRAFISQIQVIKTSKKTIFVVIVTNFGVVKNKSYKIDFEITNEQLFVLNNFLNKSFCNIPVDELTPAAVQTLIISLGDFSLSLSPLIYNVYQLAKDITRSGIFIEGQNNLLSYTDFSHNIIDMLNLLSSKQNIINIMSLDLNDIDILIGDETSYNQFEGSSIVVAKYKIDNRPIGSIGIIGPDRMNYSKVVPHMEYFASILSEILNDYFE